MAEMEKEGRPPENKRSRKPAHPVKREINEEMKNFAENTMNELLGWYGYDKVELKEGEDIEIKNYPVDVEGRQHVSVLKENSLPKLKLSEDSVITSPSNSNSSFPGMTAGNGLLEMPAGSKDHGGIPIIVPLIPPPILKPPTDDEMINVQIVCAWCQKLGIKRYSLSMGSEVKSFCSEKCFAACRRAYFKRNKSMPFTAEGWPFESSPGSHRVQQPRNRGSPTFARLTRHGTETEPGSILDRIKDTTLNQPSLTAASNSKSGLEFRVDNMFWESLVSQKISPLLHH